MSGHSIVSQHFMEPEGSIPNSQDLSACSYPWPIITYHLKTVTFWTARVHLQLYNVYLTQRAPQKLERN
jgi:hypothetical protein